MVNILIALVVVIELVVTQRSASAGPGCGNSPRVRKGSEGSEGWYYDRWCEDSRWWQLNYFFHVHPHLGKISNLMNISHGLKPPTSYYRYKTLHQILQSDLVWKTCVFILSLFKPSFGNCFFELKGLANMTFTLRNSHSFLFWSLVFMSLCVLPP